MTLQAKLDWFGNRPKCHLWCHCWNCWWLCAWACQSTTITEIHHWISGLPQPTGKAFSLSLAGHICINLRWNLCSILYGIEISIQGLFESCFWCYGFGIAWLLYEVCGVIWDLSGSNFVVCCLPWSPKIHIFFLLFVLRFINIWFEEGVGKMDYGI